MIHYVKKSKSYQHLLTQVVHLIVAPQIWLRRARDAIKIKNNPKGDIDTLGEISFETKIHMAYLWVIKNSKELYSPPQLDASHNITSHNGIICIKDTLDSRLFKSQEIPIIGKDQ